MFANYFWCFGLMVTGRAEMRDDAERAAVVLQSRGRGWFTINYYRKDSAFLSLEVPSPHAHLLGPQCPPPEERHLSMPETGEKESNCLFKSDTDLE